MGSDDPADSTMKGKAWLMLLAGLVLIAFQVLTVCGVLIGVMIPACKISKQCEQAGMFCAPDLQRCSFCGMHGPLVFLNQDNLVDCPWAAEETGSGRAEGRRDKCLMPGNTTLVLWE